MCCYKNQQVIDELKKLAIKDGFITVYKDFLVGQFGTDPRVSVIGLGTIPYACGRGS